MSTGYSLVLVTLVDLILILTCVKYVFCQNDSVMSGFIVGGALAPIKEHPHAAYIAVSCHQANQQVNTWLCGGSVVNQVLILTAAHCLFICTQESYVLVRVGEEDKRLVKQESPAEKFVSHSGFNSDTVTCDVALILLKNTLKLGSHVMRVALMKNPPMRQIAVIAGWGRVSEDGDKTNLLKAAKQRLVPTTKCEKFINAIPPHTFCAGDLDDEDYVAKGDSGSALIIEDFIQIGIVSYRTPKLSKGLAVYTKVQDFIDWIRMHAKMLYCAKSRITMVIGLFLYLYLNARFY